MLELQGVASASISSYLVPSNAALWLPLFNTTDCIDRVNYLYGFPYRSGYSLVQDSYCIECPPTHGFDEFLTVLPCSQSRASYCFKTWQEISSSESDCSGASECSLVSEATSNSDTCLGLHNGTQWCGACEISPSMVGINQSFHCREHPLSLAECTTKTACYLNNGSLIYTTSSAACLSISSCSAASAVTQVACASAGHCIDSHFGLNAAEIFTNPTTGQPGACLARHHPWRNPECDDSFFRVEKFGCISYRLNTTACAAKGYKWVLPPTSKADCDAFGKMCYRPLDSTLSQVHNRSTDITRPHHLTVCLGFLQRLPLHAQQRR